MFAICLIVLMSVTVCPAKDQVSGQPSLTGTSESTESLRNRLDAPKDSSTKKTQADEKQEETPTAVDVRKSEQEFRIQLNEVMSALNSLEKRVAEFRLLVTPPTRGEIARLNQELELVERAAKNLEMPSPSSLARLQTAELQDRLFELQLAVGIMGRRWGDSWKVFGVEFFSNSAQVPAPESFVPHQNYAIRVGDRLQVVVTSSIGGHNEYETRVDQSGFVSVSGIGRVRAAGRTVSQLREDLTKRLSSRFSQLTADVSVIRTQPLMVHVSGEVAKPGPYAISGLATVFSALVQAGGPTKAGTFRRISLVRAGKPKRTIDLYKFLTKGDNSDDLALQEGDLIFVPPVGGTIVVDGEVVRPARYEPDFPTTLGEALKLAGGPSSTGYLQSVQVERIVNGEFRVLLDSPSARDGKDSAFLIQPGDQITVRAVRLDRTNQVAIVGPVGAPGLYGYREGMRVSDLIKAAQGFAQDREIYGSRADILRADQYEGVELISFDLDKALAGDAEQDMPLQKLDQVFIYEPDQVIYKPRLVTVLGAVSKPGNYNRLRGMTFSDAIAAAGGVTPDAYLSRADLVRRNDDGTSQLIRVDLAAALTRNPGADAKLDDRDIITVYTNDEANWSDRTVRVEGAVQRPGVYKRLDGMRLSDLLLTSGGILPEASKAVELARWTETGESRIIKVDLGSLASGSDQDIALHDRDVLTVPEVHMVVRAPEVVFLSGEVARPGPYTLQRDEKLVDLIHRAGGVTPWADKRGLMFLRQKTVLENPQQAKDVDIILQKSRIFADKQFVMSLAKLGMALPTQYVEAIQASADELAKPAEVATEEGEGSGQQVTEQGKATAAVGKDKSKADLKEERETTAKSSRPEELEKLRLEPTPREIETATAVGPKVPEAAEISDLDLPMFKGRSELAELAASARISVDLERAYQDPNSADNIPLRGGDRIAIPRITNVVTVIGAVLHPHAFAAGQGKSVEFYIERSGGFAQDAAKGSVVVVKSNGDAIPMARARSAEPGDTIVVPTTGLIDIAKRWERIGPVTKVISDVLSAAYILTRL